MERGVIFGRFSHGVRLKLFMKNVDHPLLVQLKILTVLKVHGRYPLFLIFIYETKS